MWSRPLPPTILTIYYPILMLFGDFQTPPPRHEIKFEYPLMIENCNEWISKGQFSSVIQALAQKC